MSFYSRIAEEKVRTTTHSVYGQEGKYKSRYGYIRDMYWYVSGDNAGKAELFTDLGVYEIPLTILDLKRPIKKLELSFRLKSDKKGTYIHIFDKYYQTFSLKYDWIAKYGILEEE